jgi:hypothetical protein
MRTAWGKSEYLFRNGEFCGACYFEDWFMGYEQVREAALKEFGEENKPFPDQEYYVWGVRKH